MSELFPTKTIAIEYLSCTDESRTYEFNRWYKEVHIPDLLQTPGIANVYRYRNIAENVKEGQPRYISLYRIDSDDPWSLMQKVVKEDNKKRAEQGRMIDCIKSYQVGVWDFIAMRRSIVVPQRPPTRLPDGMPEAMLVVPSICTDTAREKEFNDWYLYTHFHDLLETPGLVQASRYQSLNPKPDDREARYLALYEIDSDNPLAVVGQITDEDQSKRRPQGRIIDCIKTRYASGTYEHIDL
jgi:cytidylate kinase